MAKIFLEGLEFYAHHGYFSEEQKIGGKYLIDIEIEADINKSVISDELKSTINYAEVYELIKQEMNISSRLIEHLAGRILRAVFINFPLVSGVKVKVSKINPPLGADLKSVSVVLEERRPE
ncbi:MAG: dihydroneopterin aldolase [Bacteroidales bacterium]|nr:dihydroneopterin aldolase [Bacteroidales bacterium]MBN2820332.1 dihydroneopterin aldolase [Bacteroidales bacterium]